MNELFSKHHSRNASNQFYNYSISNNTEKDTAGNDKIYYDEQSELALQLQGQFSQVNSSRKKPQEVYFRHKGDTNFKIGTNIDFILESEPEPEPEVTQGQQSQNNPLMNTQSQQTSKDNDKLLNKKFDSNKNDEVISRAVSEDLSSQNRKIDLQHQIRKQLNVAMKVYKFINNLMKFQILNSQYMIKQFQLSIINDPVCLFMNEWQFSKFKPKGVFFSRFSRSQTSFLKGNNFEEQQEKTSEKLIRILADMTNNCFSKVGIIHPQSKFKTVWQLLHLIIMLMILFILPVEVALFETDFAQLYPYKFNGLSKGAFGFFLVDIFIQLNTGVFDKGTILTDRQELAKRYIKNNLLLDLITAITLFAKEFGLPKFINVFILCKIPSFQRILDEIQEANLSKSNVTFKNVLKLTRLVIELLFIAHIYACIFLLINSLELHYNYTQTWMTTYTNYLKKDINTLTWHYKYMMSFYLCMTTMTTVGYGDITPQNQIETIFYIFSLMTLCGVFAYSFNLVGVIVQEMNKKNKEFKRDISLVNYYMEKLSISNELKYQVRKYLEYQHIYNEDITLSEEQYILNKLSPALKEKLILDAHIQIIKKCGGVFSMYSEEFIEKVCLNFSKQKFSKGEIIFKPFQKEQDQCFYFIDDGEIDLFSESPSIQYQTDNYLTGEDDKDNSKEDKEKTLLDLNSNVQILKTLEKNQYFGEICFYTNGVRKLGAICKKNSRCFVIQRSKFIKLLKKYPKDYELFCKIRDKLIIDNNGYIVGTACYSCNQYNHTFQNCYLLQQKFDKEKIFLQENKPFFQNRNQIRKQRRRRLKFNCLVEQKNIAEKVELKRVSLDDVESDSNEEDDQIDDNSQTSNQDIQSIEVKIKDKKVRKKNTRNYSSNTLQIPQKSVNIFKQSSIDTSKSLNNIQQTEGNEELQKKSVSNTYLQPIVENESIKEYSPLKYSNPYQNENGNHQNSMKQITLQKYSEEKKFPNKIFPSQQSMLQLNTNPKTLQQQLMLASFQNMILQKREGQESQRNSIVRPQGTYEQLQMPPSPLIKNQSPIQIDSPQVQKFGYRFLAHETENDPLIAFQQQLQAIQQQQQPYVSLLHEQENQQNLETHSITKIQRQNVYCQGQMIEPFTQLLLQQQQDQIKGNQALATLLEISTPNNQKAKYQKVSEVDTHYVIEEHMQEFRVYYPEYNFSVVRFRLPRTTKDYRNFHPAFCKYTYFNRVIKKNDRKKSRKQSEKVIPSNHRMSLMHQYA
ncbi:cyclic nucleotide-binding domain protein (macronuclear) [Tetrahymena thermophila SB210]|uniref:Cyclic nucleotide-binding domain protein n=1 Tax=Tetrahymena thermophila (strain SB210) TaxID=312017 RepID=I7M039_TETTS|nr:cyclic nucleotide-binding domain protein [Tetrahymena thermophila SB210]EAR85432.2 cyclic nucleotide-binding domain protein [Tetrahymena thermophila SB210]|eukprot:XP_001033095.2 cyclic nucleotide-binding domain protein [Tetrahymena thermophila SB210]